MCRRSRPFSAATEHQLELILRVTTNYLYGEHQVLRSYERAKFFRDPLLMGLLEEFWEETGASVESSKRIRAMQRDSLRELQYRRRWWRNRKGSKPAL